MGYKRWVISLAWQEPFAAVIGMVFIPIKLSCMVSGY